MYKSFLQIFRLNDIQEIENRVYISNGLTAHCLKSLKQNKITHIINVTDNLINKFPDEFDYIVIDESL